MSISIRKFPIELEKVIYDYAFDIDVAFLVKECLNDGNYLYRFVEEHSEFMLEKINWFDFFVSLLDASNDNYIINIESNLKSFIYLTKRSILDVDEEQIYFFYMATTAFNGDNYLFEKYPRIIDEILKIPISYKDLDY